MAEIYRSDIVRVDLDRALLRKHVGAILVTGDKLGNRFGAEIFRDGNPVDVTGCGVTAYFMRPGEDAIVLNGTASGSVAYVDLAQACYSKASSFTLTIKISYGGATTALRVIDGYILLTQTDDLVDPGDVVPTLDDIFAQIATMEAATERAQAATADAIAAKDNANGAAVNAVNIATEKGDQAIQLAQEEADKQNMKIAALTQDIDRNTAPPIIPTVTGEIVSVSDSTHRPFAGLRLYGKTTQDGVPTPNSPIPLVNVGAGGSIGVHSRGKNLWSLGDIVATYYTAPVTEAFRSLAPNEQYTLSWKYSSNGTADAQNVIIVYTDAGGINIANGMPFTITEAQLRTLQSAYAYFGSDMTSGSMTDIVLSAGSDAIAYEPYKDGGSLNASTPNGLLGIKVSSGGNYTDASGQQWVCDYKDYERGVHVQRIGQKVVTAPEVLSLSYNYANVAYYAIARQDDNANKGVANPRMGMCDRFAMGTVDAWDSAAGINLMLTNADFIYDWFGFAPGTTLEGARNVMDGMTILYILAAPVETPIPADEMAAYRAMTSQYPNTTAYNDAGAGMAVDYIADTKNYIDGKLAAIAAATL